LSKIKGLSEAKVDKIKEAAAVIIVSKYDIETEYNIAKNYEIARVLFLLLFLFFSCSCYVLSSSSLVLFFINI
jgi:hypothetical protein